jgi:ADP-ribose pyrophosphatase YjhB (NUDIX family)
MAGVDYYNDPNAPEANSLVPSVSAVVRDDDGRLLMVHQTHDDHWALPGGAMRLGESVADAAVREVAEATGVRVEITDLVGLYTGPGHVVAYPGGEVRQEFCICFHGRPLGAEPREGAADDRADTAAGADAAAGAAKWIPIDQLDTVPIHVSTRTSINDGLSDSPRPRIL